jgi:hypothetical protein
MIGLGVTWLLLCVVPRTGMTLVEDDTESRRDAAYGRRYEFEAR